MPPSEIVTVLRFSVAMVSHAFTAAKAINPVRPCRTNTVSGSNRRGVAVRSAEVVDVVERLSPDRAWLSAVSHIQISAAGQVSLQPAGGVCVDLSGVFGVGSRFGAWFLGQGMAHSRYHHQLGVLGIGVSTGERLAQLFCRLAKAPWIVAADDEQHGRLAPPGDFVGARDEVQSPRHR